MSTVFTSLNAARSLRAAFYSLLWYGYDALRFSSQSSSCAFTFSCISKNSALSLTCPAAVSADSTLQTSLRSSFIVTVFTSSAARSLRAAFLCAFLFAAVKIGDGASQHPRQFRQFVCAGVIVSWFPNRNCRLCYAHEFCKLLLREIAPNPHVFDSNHVITSTNIYFAYIIAPQNICVNSIFIKCLYFFNRLDLYIDLAYIVFEVI